MTTEQRKAVMAIRNYLNKDLADDYILANYDLAVDQLIQNATNLQNMKIAGVKSMSEGNQSISFQDGAEAWSITEDVKSLLPLPYVKMY